MTLMFGGTALASGSSLKVRGPGTVKVGSSFTLKVSGKASGKANFLVGYEGGITCKSSYKSERKHVSGTNVVLSQTVHGKFSLTHSFTSTFAGKRAFCVYLINKKSFKTVRHAAAHWTATP